MYYLIYIFNHINPMNNVSIIKQLLLLPVFLVPYSRNYFLRLCPEAFLFIYFFL